MVQIRRIVAVTIVSRLGTVSCWLISHGASRIAFFSRIASRQPLRMWHQKREKDCWPFVEIDDKPVDSSGVEILSRGSFGNIFGVCLNRKEVDESQLRPGQSRTDYNRVLGCLSTSKESSVLLCLHRFKIWWIRPVFWSQEDKKLSAVPPETILILYREEPEQFRLVLAIPTPDTDGGIHCVCSLCGQKSGSICLTSTTTRSKTSSTMACLYCGVGPDPYQLIGEATELATRVLLGARTRDTESQGIRRDTVGVHNTLGWNTFYTKVSSTKILAGIKELHAKHNIPVQWLILDDGWQHTTGAAVLENGKQWSQRLKTKRASPSWEMSLTDCVSSLKEKHGLHSVWAWHTLTGYWLGLEPSSPDFQNTTSMYYPHFSKGILNSDPSASQEASVKLGIGIPNDARSFYQDYHTYLAEGCGVDGVKVDAQAVIGTLRSFKWNEEKAKESNTSRDDRKQRRDDDLDVAMDLQDALAESIRTNFGSTPQKGDDDDDKTMSPQSGTDMTPHPIIHCMAHAPEIFFRLPLLYGPRRPWLRASDDHYPDNPYSHGPHVVACSFNSLLLSQYAVPDWDMFTTSASCLTLEHAKIHTVARAVSGGLIVLSDSPHDDSIRPEVTNWLVCDNGVTLPCREAALPVPKCLLQDPLAPGADPFVVYNTNGRPPGIKDLGVVTSGVFGVSHVAGSGEWDYSKLDYGPCRLSEPLQPRTVSVRPTDIPYYVSKNQSDTRFMARSFFQNSVTVLPNSTASFSMELKPGQSDVITMIPISTVDNFDVCPLGFADKLNGAGSVLQLDFSTTTITMLVQGVGRFFLAFCQNEGNDACNISVKVQDETIPHEINRSTKNATQEKNSGIPNGVLESGFDLLSFALQQEQNIVHRVAQVVSIEFS